MRNDHIANLVVYVLPISPDRSQDILCQVLERVLPGPRIHDFLNINAVVCTNRQRAKRRHKGTNPVGEPQNEKDEADDSIPRIEGHDAFQGVAFSQGNQNG